MIQCASQRQIDIRISRFHTALRGGEGGGDGDGGALRGGRKGYNNKLAFLSIQDGKGFHLIEPSSFFFFLSP